MIEKPKRPKKIPNQDNKQPQTIQELIRRYDLDNTKIYNFLDELVEQLKFVQKQNLDKFNETETKFEETVLYNNPAGTTEDVILNETSANFSYIEVYFALEVGEGTYCFSQKINAPDGKVVGYSFNRPANASATENVLLQLFGGRFSISGNSIVRDFESFISIDGYHGTVTTADNSKIRINIVKIVGYR